MNRHPHQLYPLLLAPILHRRVWGGERLTTLHPGEPPVLGPAGEPVGESWLLGPDNVVLNGVHAGSTLHGLTEELAAALVGAVAHEHYGPRVPLLLKLLHAREALSVQVHPDDAYALKHEPRSGHLGKSEAWYVLDAEPGASVLWGLQHPLTTAAFREAATAGTLPGLMQRVFVKAGDLVVNPAGTLHAVGAGTFLFEIQQASDLTYRVFDYGRLGADGQPRQLHLEKALAVADLSGAPFSPPMPTALPDGWERLVTSPEFSLDRRRVTPAAPARGRTDPSSMESLTVVEGRLELAPVGARGPGGAAWPPLTLGLGATVLLPAMLGCEYSLTGSGTALRGAVGREAA